MPPHRPPFVATVNRLDHRPLFTYNSEPGGASREEEVGMSQTPSRMVLTTARSLIADRRCWLQHGWKRGNQYVMRRCAFQAVVDAAKSLGLDATRPLGVLAGVIACEGADPRETIPGFNDCHSHSDVMAMFDLAIETV